MVELTLPGPADVLAAAARIAAHATVTPVLRSRALDALSGAHLHFKAEHLQRGGAFKFRGACNAVWALDEAQARHGVVTHSSGNHGAALALAAQSRGIPCHVVVPEGAVAAKLANIARHGATLWRCAPTQAAREAECARVQRDTGAVLVHPYADARVIAGQGTATLELLRQAGTALDVVVVPAGGGGLASGTLLALQQAAPGCELVLAEPAGAADTARSLAAGRRLVDFVPDTVCDGLRGALGEPNFALLHGKATAITVDDAATVAAMRLLWQVLKQVVEPSSATVLAAVLAQPARFAGRNVGLVLSGGNVDLDALPWMGA
ncbi:MAG: serine dehydratase [Lysobacteraceae bacterium SCN 69-123]|jgi:threonine dehydratase|uniref:pyridoxal-phosphate dependent enzyme n=1 Tax=Stenotrophomonas acidaminiphila TaxID=128780 RepID=UPI00086CF2EB|nr:pyridoxal-phosphate dependent enzyme [Stenotrophomonas acidaminiphila]ODU45782.1 MAG: serine dehydratase [Xanthomonadaceae bacterium SCN 69-123]OJY76043.1 MAG: serine dehydratase [Stenotrophomonas sp. 69-14]MBN8801813.1 pyridoxal-phosphate dependent enzyme [Stenotrophomonas acidaminiphila]MDF9442357.1 pyridoxal-phosphate dependent enzyme [Stenotrophomonas acidaminiphila]WHL19024.1 pyridoxal-phosphate dependent enzyme [Stenotrophomonas acidaminiphila]